MLRLDKSERKRSTETQRPSFVEPMQCSWHESTGGLFWRFWRSLKLTPSVSDRNPLIAASEALSPVASEACAGSRRGSEVRSLEGRTLLSCSKLFPELRVSRGLASLQTFPASPGLQMLRGRAGASVASSRRVAKGTGTKVLQCFYSKSSPCDELVRAAPFVRPTAKAPKATSRVFCR